MLAVNGYLRPTIVNAEQWRFPGKCLALRSVAMKSRALIAKTFANRVGGRFEKNAAAASTWHDLTASYLPGTWQCPVSHRRHRSANS